MLHDIHANIGVLNLQTEAVCDNPDDLPVKEEVPAALPTLRPRFYYPVTASDL